MGLLLASNPAEPVPGAAPHVDRAFSCPVPVGAVLQPEARLMLAVLEDAISVLGRREVFATTSGQRLLRETEGWFAADDVDWPFSFVNVCDALHLDVSRLRAWLAQQRMTRPAPARPLRISDGSKLSRSGARQARAMGWVF